MKFVKPRYIWSPLLSRDVSYRRALDGPMTQVVLVSFVCFATVGMYSASQSPSLIWLGHPLILQSAISELEELKVCRHNASRSQTDNIDIQLTDVSGYTFSSATTTLTPLQLTCFFVSRR